MHELLTNLTPQILDEIAVMREDDLISLHFSLGMRIRNAFGLFEEGSELRADAARVTGVEDIHPDSASSLIIHQLWTALSK